MKSELAYFVLCVSEVSHIYVVNEIGFKDIIQL